MNKMIILLVLLVAIVGLTGCVATESRNDGTFSTQKEKTECGLGGCKTTKKTCPFWDRDC